MWIYWWYYWKLGWKTISEKKNEDIKLIIEHVSKKFLERDLKLKEKLNFHYFSKNLICSKKLEDKINSLTSLNELLKIINPEKPGQKVEKGSINLKEFCQLCKKYKILNLLYDKNINEEVVKILSDIIYVMYENNFWIFKKWRK